jgi:hypothetical protein
MTPDRWQMVRGILQSAMEMRPAEPSAFLDRECASDPSLRKDVDEMLSIEGKLDPEFLESPAAQQQRLSSNEVESFRWAPDGKSILYTKLIMALEMSARSRWEAAARNN